MYKILYVHGLGETKNEKTIKELRNLLKDERGVYVYSADFSVYPYSWATEINKLVGELDIDCIVSSGLGAFMTLNMRANRLNRNINPLIVLINPVMEVKEDVQKTQGLGIKEFANARENGDKTYTLDKKFYKSLSEIEGRIFSEIKSFNLNNVYGVFSTDDELFKHKYDYYKKINSNIIEVEDFHRISTNSLKNAVVPLILKDIKNKANK